MKIKPIGDRVLVKMEEAEEKTASGLFIPQTAQEKTQTGTVEAIGDDKDVITVKKGDKVTTTGGIYGKVNDVKDRTVTLEIADNVIVKVDKSAVVADPGDQPAPAKK